MSLLIDENVPNAVAEFFRSRGHAVVFVREVLPAGTPDAVVAAIGDRDSLIVVTWDKDFKAFVSRIPKGNRNRFRNLGRISFQCNYPRGRPLLEEWIDLIEARYTQGCKKPTFKMLAVVQESGIKFM